MPELQPKIKSATVSQFMIIGIAFAGLFHFLAVSIVYSGTISFDLPFWSVLVLDAITIAFIAVVGVFSSGD